VEVTHVRNQAFGPARADRVRRFCTGAPTRQGSTQGNHLDTEPRENIHGRFYVRDDFKKKNATGRPSVPTEWEPLLKKPVHGKVSELLEDGRAIVNLGAENGIWKGMELCTFADRLGLAEVVHVNARTCVIRSRFGGVLSAELKKDNGVHSSLTRKD
jgi:hypothetical protein